MQNFNRSLKIMLWYIFRKMDPGRAIGLMNQIQCKICIGRKIDPSTKGIVSRYLQMYLHVWVGDMSYNEENNEILNQEKLNVSLWLWNFPDFATNGECLGASKVKSIYKKDYKRKKFDKSLVECLGPY